MLVEGDKATSSNTITGTLTGPLLGVGATNCPIRIIDAVRICDVDTTASARVMEKAGMHVRAGSTAISGIRTLQTIRAIAFCIQGSGKGSKKEARDRPIDERKRRSAFKPAALA